MEDYNILKAKYIALLHEHNELRRLKIKVDSSTQTEFPIIDNIVQMIYEDVVSFLKNVDAISVQVNNDLENFIFLLISKLKDVEILDQTNVFVKYKVNDSILMFDSSLPKLDRIAIVALSMLCKDHNKAMKILYKLSQTIPSAFRVMCCVSFTSRKIIRCFLLDALFSDSQFFCVYLAQALLFFPDCLFPVEDVYYLAFKFASCSKLQKLQQLPLYLREFLESAPSKQQLQQHLQILSTKNCGVLLTQTLSCCWRVLNSL